MVINRKIVVTLIFITASFPPLQTSENSDRSLTHFYLKDTTRACPLCLRIPNRIVVGKLNRNLKKCFAFELDYFEAYLSTDLNTRRGPVCHVVPVSQILPPANIHMHPFGNGTVPDIRWISNRYGVGLQLMDISTTTRFLELPKYSLSDVYPYIFAFNRLEVRNLCDLNIYPSAEFKPGILVPTRYKGCSRGKNIVFFNNNFGSSF